MSGARHEAGPRNNAKPKTTAEQILDILDRYEQQGQSPAQISRILSIPYSTVRGITYGGNGTKTVALAK
ncbi:hypothetical protein UFOVP1670_51 [uncultured Caudovirales phage]|uniref:Uncharacterized protein n=1 Tax=uncultured Caudovirales phage TaxID=2100421 RepID=A0A6J5T7C2_9CAUD|nr:hypothetical protein UFOVP1670_51 [uncultured Caudovirales phage]